MHTIKFDTVAHDSMDSLVNDKMDIGIIQYIYNKSLEGMVLPKENTQFDLWSKKANVEINKDFHDQEVFEAINEAINMLHEEEERDFINKIMDKSDETKRNLIESCKNAYFKNYDLLDVVLILNLTYNVNCRKYSFTVITNEEEFDKTIEQLTTIFNMAIDEAK